ncbi:ComEC/Rec2 family competence protein [Crenalkalicoccus roseus]|uniref:ComEC/Rec2 family competence protein n=1 Tax=Crenalkalicoccus roseus TaxID=1485588 RepID=UPI001081E1F9|nr:ComEC/Rec2 family competence protein [Crenalkalicoccus roseus]
MASAATQTLASPLSPAARLAGLFEAERLRLAPWLAIALGLGIAAYFALPEEPDPAWRWAALPPLLLALALAPRAPLAAWCAGLPAAAALGAAVASWHAARQPPMPDLPRGAVIVSGVVTRVELLPEGQRITLDAPRLDGGEPLARHLRIRLRATDPVRPRPGERLRVRALIRPPAPPAYPGGWDFQRAAWFGGLGGSGFALGMAELEAEERGRAPPLAALRADIEARVAAALPGPTGGVAAALLTGGRSAIPAPDLAALRDAGLAHLLSVSGLHIGIVFGVSFAVVRLALAALPWAALRLPVKSVAAVAALAAGGFYMLLSGAQVPMQRSFAMAALATLALLTGRRALTLRAWGLAFAGVLLIEPVALLGPSFQMSFAAVLALIAGWEWLRPRLARTGGASRREAWRRRLLLGAFGIAATSLLAGAATTPFGLHHFGRLQLYGVAANMLAVPITSLLVMPAGMLAVALMPLGLEGLALAPMGWGVEAILRVARQVASWPGAAFSAPPIPAWGLGVTAFGMAWLCLWRARWRLLGLPLIAAGLASAAAVRPPDLLVSADARLIGLRSAEGLHLQRLSGASSLVAESWLRLYAEAAARPLPREGEAGEGAIACTAGACWFRPRSEGAVAVLLRGGPAREACAGAALVVSAEPVRGRCAARVVDRFSVWREGAHAVWLEADGVRVLSDRAWRGDRPWVPPPPRPRGAREPPAATIPEDG